MTEIFVIGTIALVGLIQIPAHFIKRGTSSRWLNVLAVRPQVTFIVYNEAYSYRQGQQERVLIY
jgi:hypothetical protein